jgi:hypothetical protein
LQNTQLPTISHTKKYHFIIELIFWVDIHCITHFVEHFPIPNKLTYVFHYNTQFIQEIPKTYLLKIFGVTKSIACEMIERWIVAEDAVINRKILSIIV